MKSPRLNLESGSVPPPASAARRKASRAVLGGPCADHSDPSDMRGRIRKRASPRGDTNTRSPTHSNESQNCTRPVRHNGSEKLDRSLLRSKPQYDLQMGLARELERRLERLVDGVSGTLFRGKVHPVDIGARLVREADLAVFATAAGPGVPNRYDIAIGSPDQSEPAELNRVARELEHTLDATAAQHGWRLEGPAAVNVSFDPAVKAHGLRIVASVVPGALTPWAQLINARRQINLTHNRTLVGRADECDVTLDEREVSRRHAVIYRGEGRTWIEDLRSSNGTKVDGGTVNSLSAVRPGATIVFGPTTFMFRIVDQ